MLKYYLMVACLSMLSMNGESPITQRLNQLYSRVIELRKDWADLLEQERATNAAKEQQERRAAVEDISELLKKYQPTANDLSVAAALNYIPLMQLLISAGAPVNGRTTSQETPLMIAAQYGQPEAVQFLINNGADVFARNNKGRTAKDFAFESKGLSSNDVYINIHPGLVVALNSLSSEQRIAQTIGILARAMRAATQQMQQVQQPQITMPMPQVSIPRARL